MLGGLCEPAEAIMPQPITEDQLASLYHNVHAERFGAKENCAETACVKAKMAIAWLEERTRFFRSFGQELSNPPGFDRIQDICRLFP
jgi:hypothetical protein